jgi:hypothetical protein
MQSAATWDLFRYPGVRSDSDMHILGFPPAMAGGRGDRRWSCDLELYPRDAHLWVTI